MVNQLLAVVAQTQDITGKDVRVFLCSSTIAEQEAIAEALSDADALIEALEELIAKKRQVKQGAMQELLQGKDDWSGKWKVGSTTSTIGSYQLARIDIQGIPLIAGDYYPNYSELNIKNGYID